MKGLTLKTAVQTFFVRFTGYISGTEGSGIILLMERI